MARPASLEEYTFCDYFRGFCFHTAVQDEVSCQRGGLVLIGNDNFGRFVYELDEPRLCKFSDPSPIHDPDGYFYNRILQERPFRSEENIMPRPFTSYFDYYMHMHCPHTQDDCHAFLEHHLLSYAGKHMYDSAYTEQLCQLGFALLETRDARVLADPMHGIDDGSTEDIAKNIHFLDSNCDFGLEPAVSL